MGSSPRAGIILRHHGLLRERAGHRRGDALIRLGRIERDEGLAATLLAKVEYLNPGGSVKDRPAVKMLEVAEEQGLLKPGGTVVEPTSGNTGAGLVLAAAVKGYRCICVMPEKASKEKQDLLKAMGAEVVVTPSAPPEDPESYYKVAERLADEIPGGFKPGQYENPANPWPTTRPPAPSSGGRPPGASRTSSAAWALAGPSPARGATSKSRTRT